MVLASQTGLGFYLKVIPSLICLIAPLLKPLILRFILVSVIILKTNALSGLRIAPPEAPVTGYMFGKGVYFADMFSKSANYCYASHTAKDGVLLLCEVGFGLIVNVVENLQ